jgi:hypothetical protein
MEADGALLTSRASRDCPTVFSVDAGGGMVPGL